MSKKNCILDTTLSLIKDHGFHGTSMSMIACKAGAATGTIYHHYSSKDDLIIDLFKKVNQDLLDHLEVSFDETIPFQERFCSFWKSQYHFYVKHPEALMFLEQFMNSPYYLEVDQAYVDSLYQEVRSFFNNGMENGFIKNMNKEILTPVVRGSITATARLHLAGKHTFQDDDLDKIADLVWCGIKI
ncbi:MAG: TetR/AcrR family transcriptional regulator [Pedobacter sp.]|nr:MAG: TetR/AcrR family transcriptional regulator [Pedobacter sp.]